MFGRKSSSINLVAEVLSDFAIVFRDARIEDCSEQLTISSKLKIRILGMIDDSTCLNILPE